MRPLLPDLEQPALRAWDCALHQQQIALGVDRMNGETDLRPALPAHASGHLDALEDARRRRGRADRAGLADVVRAVRDGAAREVVALDRALEAFAHADAARLDLVARLERLHGHGFADHRFRRSS